MPDKYPYVDENEIEWNRPDEMLDSELDSSLAKTPFIMGDASSNEVLQGKLANCWFVSALSVLATSDELIRGGGEWAISQNLSKIDYWTAQMCSMGVYPPIFHKFRYKKIYILRFFKDF